MSNEDIQYIVSEASLKNIADAIRGNLSADLSLTFPNQFQDVIKNLKPTSDSFQEFCESGTTFGASVSLKIPDIVSHIGKNAFKDCLGISEVLFSDNSICTQIGDYSFSGCINLEKITLPRCIQTLGNGCFITGGYQQPITV